MEKEKINLVCKLVYVCTQCKFKLIGFLVGFVQFTQRQQSLDQMQMSQSVQHLPMFAQTSLQQQYPY